MASPIAHTLAGATIYLWSIKGTRLVDWREFLHRHWPFIALFAVLANLSDGDFILGWIATGDANAYHHGWTHSIAFAAVAAIITAWIIKIRPGFAANWLWYFLAAGSHLLIDVVTGPNLGQPAFGIPALWPAVPTDFRSPFSVVVGPKHHQIAHLFSLHNWLWGAYEALIFGLLLLFTAKLTILKKT